MVECYACSIYLIDCTVMLSVSYVFSPSEALPADYVVQLGNVEAMFVVPGVIHLA